MLYALGFARIAVVMGDLYFVDPDPLPGQEGAERGVRLEVRLLEPGELKGSIYSARPIVIDRPVWRVDLLEAVTGPRQLGPGTPPPGLLGVVVYPRSFVHGLSAQPLE